MVAAVLFASFAVLLLIGAPIAVCLGISSVASMLVLGAGRPIDSVLGTIPQLVSAATSKTVLLAIPFFILGGNIMDKSGISAKLICLAETCVGHFRGGVAMVCVIVACFFAAISGSGPATVAALGLILIPALIKTGYKPAFSAALMAAAGAIGVIIPPSITFVVYGSISDTSIGDLFISGVVPGLLMGLTLILVTLILGRKSDLTKMPKAAWKERWVAFKDAFWGLLMPVIILGGIFSGIFSITEASGVAVVYSAIIAFFVNRSVKLKDIPDMIIEAASTSGLVLILAGAGTAMAWGIANERVMSLLIEPLSQMPQWGFLLLVNVLLLVCGMFMDDYASTVILAPIIAPIAWAIGINPLHIGLVFCINLVVGLATPPFGVTLFVTSPIAGVRIEQTAKEALPFLLMTIAILLLVTFVPDIALWLPESMGYLS